MSSMRKQWGLILGDMCFFKLCFLKKKLKKIIGIAGWLAVWHAECRNNKCNKWILESLRVERSLGIAEDPFVFIDGLLGLNADYMDGLIGSFDRLRWVFLY